MENKKKEAFKATDEQITEWKKKYGEDKVHELTVADKRAYLRTPDRNVLGLASVAGKDNPMAYNETILDNCWLAGDEEIRTVDSYFLGAGSALAEIVEMKEATIKKL
jgi:hypothetical protein